MNFRYKITDLTHPQDRFVPPEIVNVGSNPELNPVLLGLEETQLQLFFRNRKIFSKIVKE